ncbi:ribonuclease HIII [Jeotgalibacillus haloalkalitolerans]|uniref:Ribonuclease HIII n=1 Tax=Jeotgalibacillus haloalkalitolerans TaxID=3104292 RepID=A0ABU5KMC2_9BACL|nr:ribonuclease HIII [Jeotgalibacillus sp. HH7-29]MDZ5712415.1 ribonuclease HIII [Jeotgalibacillus sp. HH7-29]
MANAVLTLPITKINEMKTHYQRYLKPSPPAGALFAAKGPTYSITAYKSGKVLFQGQTGEQEAARWGDAEQKTKKVSSPSNKSLPQNISQMSIIGTDEVGTGDYFGPITVVAAYVSNDQLQLLKELGVKDSKHLNDETIVKIAKDLIHTISYSLLTLPNEKYNAKQQQGWTQGKIKAVLHNQAILHLRKKIAPVTPECVLIDQFAEEKVYYRHISGEKAIYRENVYFSTKAEGIHLAVAAASIIARYAFIKAMDQLSEEAGFTLPKGAGAKVDQAAARLIRSKGESSLEHFTKRHFANTQKAMKLV